MQWISDIIGEEYKNWNPGKLVFVTAPTGSGKTYFVVHKLLPYAIEHPINKILYLVNRRVLRDQIVRQIRLALNEMSCEGILDTERVIEVKTYQEVEQSIKANQNLFFSLEMYRYIICDECHYFRNDSLFNTDTILSYFFIRAYMINGAKLLDGNVYLPTVIFMSATMEGFDRIILNFELTRLMPQHIHLALDKISRDMKKTEYEQRAKWYCVKKDYSYLNIKWFRYRDMIPQIVEQKIKNKWVIFCNDIESGKKLEVELSKRGMDVCFIDASFDSHEEMMETKRYIVNTDSFSPDVLISTAGLDNGINFKDIQLRNLMILTDTETSFIQMLGRKRPDGEKVSLYIWAGEQSIFERRLNQYCKIQNDLIKTKQFLMPQIGFPNLDGLYQEQMRDFAFYESCRHFLTNIRRSVSSAEVILNPFSEIEIDSRIRFYEDLIDRFKSGDDKAFLRIQCEWVGKNLDEVAEIVLEGSAEEEELLKDNIRKAIRKYCGEPLDQAKNIALKVTITQDLRRLLGRSMDPRTSSLIENLRKNDRPISINQFNEIMDLLQLDFKMSGGGKGKIYTISEIVSDITA